MVKKNQNIDFRDKGDITRIMKPGTEKHQSLKGFDDDYVDIVDYILRSTHKIWEEHGIGRIYSHYRHNAPIWTSDGLTYGRDQVIQATAFTQAAFPDLRLYGDDVIWAGNDENGFHTSHRISWTGHNTGYSLYGPPTGKKIYRFGIANCYVLENKITEEWIARDELGLVMQLGFDPWQSAARMVTAQQEKGLNPQVEGEVERLRGQNLPEELPPKPSGGFDIEDFIKRSMHEIWNWRLLNTINNYYADTFVFHGPAGRELYGWGGFKGFVLSLLSPFPDLGIGIDHIYWNGNEKDGYRVATRWTLQGTHEGPGVYGEPTGKSIRILCISHQHVRNGRFVEEWAVFDEFALLKQLYTPELHGEPA